MRSKKVSDSAIEHYPVEIFPGDLNSMGNVFGGRVLAVMDKVAGYVAQKHSNMECVTLTIDSVRFLAPAKQGEILMFKAALNKVWRTSMEIGVKVYAENFRTDDSRHILSAYLTFVALDASGRPAPIGTELVSESEDEKRRCREADARRQARLSNKRR